MEIKLAFDPAELTPDDECYEAFKYGGVPLKFWALWKRNHTTCQYFQPALNQFVEKFRHSELASPYSNIDELNELLGDVCMFSVLIGVTPRWVMAHWDYFSPSINKQIHITFEREEPVIKPDHKAPNCTTTGV